MFKAAFIAVEVMWLVGTVHISPEAAIAGATLIFAIAVLIMAIKD